MSKSLEFCYWLCIYDSGCLHLTSVGSIPSCDMRVLVLCLETLASSSSSNPPYLPSQFFGMTALLFTNIAPVLNDPVDSISQYPPISLAIDSKVRPRDGYLHSRTDNARSDPLPGIGFATAVASWSGWQHLCGTKHGEVCEVVVLVLLVASSFHQEISSGSLHPELERLSISVR